MVGLLLIATAVATSFLVAVTTRRSSLVSTLLVAYVAYVANLSLVTLALSPFYALTRGGLALAEGVLLAAALAGWWIRGRPRPPLVAARAAAREVLSDPVCVLFLLVTLVLLAYEALLATSPPNNMDALTYHLSRAAAWAQDGGLHWIHNAPEVEMTAYQPLAEQQILFLFVATGKGALYALPQYLAQLAVIVSVYGAARRLGFAVRPSACAAFMLATFSVVALESMTAQIDLFTASLVGAASCLILSGGRLEPVLAGVAVALGLGAKLSVGLAVPILAWLAIAQGRRVFGAALAGGVLGFVAIGMWGYVMNYHNTGHVLGVGTGGVQNRGSPSYPGSVANAFYLMYGLMDASILSSRLIHILALVGLGVGVATAAWVLRRAGVRRAVVDGIVNALPFLAPLLVIGGAGVVAFIAGKWGFPIRGAGGLLVKVEENLNQEYGRVANENYSAYGPVGIVALVTAIGLTIRDFVSRRVGVRHLVLACALPVFLVLIALSSTWIPFLIRFFLLPAVIAAPLLARLFRSRVTTGAYLVATSIAIGLTITHVQPKPLSNPYGLGRPWNLTQETGLITNSYHYIAEALVPFEQYVPPRACVGSVLAENEPAYLLYGAEHQHKVFYLAPGVAVNEALARGLWHVVITVGKHKWVAEKFSEAGWEIRPLGNYWLLASHPGGGDGTC